MCSNLPCPSLWPPPGARSAAMSPPSPPHCPAATRRCAAAVSHPEHVASSRSGRERARRWRCASDGCSSRRRPTPAQLAGRKQLGSRVCGKATHIVLLFGPRRVSFQQQCYHRLRLTALLHRGDVQRQSPTLSTSQAVAWSVGVHTGRAGSSAMWRQLRLRGNQAAVGSRG